MQLAPDPETGHDSGCERITDLGYADDIALLASNPVQLQALLDCFGNFCNTNGLIINPTKCEMVVFGGSRAWKQHTWNVNGRRINRARQFKYLGVVLEGTQ